jgi:hypothetical protein
VHLLGQGLSIFFSSSSFSVELCNSSMLCFACQQDGMVTMDRESRWHVMGHPGFRRRRSVTCVPTATVVLPREI